MGLRKNLKKCIIRRVMKKRKSEQNFDEVASDLHQMPTDADETINHSHYFKSHDKDGNAFFFRLGQRGGKKPTAEIWFGFVTSCGKAYMNSKELYDLSDSPASAKCVVPLREWKFSFKGKMFPVSAGENLVAVPNGSEIDTEFNAVFTSKNGLFEFARDTHIDAYAEAIASEKWTKGFSEELKDNTQTRVEHVGHVKCTFKADGKIYSMDAPALRDQAYGKRYWSYMNHYSWLVGNLVDGRSFNTVMVLYPTINKTGLKTGYVMENGQYHSLTHVDYPVHFTTKGVAPVEGRATARFVDGTYAVIDFKSSIIFPYTFKDNRGAYNVFECITTFDFNDVKGMGISEFSYNADPRRYQEAFTHTTHGRILK